MSMRHRGRRHRVVMHGAIVCRESGVPVFACPAHTKCAERDNTRMQHQCDQSNREHVTAELPHRCQ